jgi:hypothetical protein
MRESDDLAEWLARAGNGDESALTRDAPPMDFLSGGMTIDRGSSMAFGVSVGTGGAAASSPAARPPAPPAP